LRVGAGGRGERVTARGVLAHRRREQGEPVHVPPPAVHLRSEVEEATHPAADRPTVHPHLSATQQRRLDGAVRRNRRQGGLPPGAILAFVERCLQQPEPRLCLGVVAAGLGQPLLDRYVPRAPGTGEGPEHCTFTVRQGGREYIVAPACSRARRAWLPGSAPGPPPRARVGGGPGPPAARRRQREPA